MRLSAFFRPIPELLAFSLLGLMILSAANAQTSSEPDDGSLALSHSARAHSIRESRTRDTNAASNAAPPSPETNAKVEFEPDAPPEPGPSAASPGPGQ